MDKYVAVVVSFGFISPFNLIDNVFKSPTHRAINRNGVDQYSIPMFFGTDYDVNIKVRASLCLENQKLM